MKIYSDSGRDKLYNIIPVEYLIVGACSIGGSFLPTVSDRLVLYVYFKIVSVKIQLESRR